MNPSLNRSLGLEAKCYADLFAMLKTALQAGSIGYNVQLLLLQPKKGKVSECFFPAVSVFFCLFVSKSLFYGKTFEKMVPDKWA